MNFKFVTAFTLASLLIGCAGVSANKELTKADATAKIAETSKVDASNAKTTLDSAKTLSQNGEEEESIRVASQSTLLFRLAIAENENAKAKAEDKRVENELRADVERKLIYQNILEEETQKEGATK